ncbi:MAG: aminotransferase class IV, partial [Candidatus Omnitrophica bacterium]|nr:aminotransferase class IV [Candidatus Omnitrophota bacterium]
VRLTLKKTGKLQLSSLPLDEPTKLPVKVTFSRNKTDRTDEFLYHKTTNRSLYDHNLAKCRAKGFFDIIYRNQQNEITEGTISNIIIRAGQTYFTPPVSCGLLPGTYRSYLLQKENFPLKERVLYKEDLLKADEIFMINSVRKMIPATLAG